MTQQRPDTLFYYVFIGGLIAGTLIRLGTRSGSGKHIGKPTVDSFLLGCTFTGMGVIPFVYIFTSALNRFSYTLPLWSGYVGSVLLSGSLLLLWRAHSDLGQNWSITPRIIPDQHLIINGVYHHLRHPIYAAYWLWALAQPLLLHNWLAGFSMAAAYTPLYFHRVPREERILLQAFGEQYREYMRSTPGIIPLKKSLSGK
ncbi:MAG: protein-S-isoprenylcysteine O-methyltransferase [Chitinispirillaceae bacterium]